jgi:hypothetical protein
MVERPQRQQLSMQLMPTPAANLNLLRCAAVAHHSLFRMVDLSAPLDAARDPAVYLYLEPAHGARPQRQLGGKLIRS